MLTNNFRAIMAAMPTNAASSPVVLMGSYAITATNGRTYYYVPCPATNHYPNTPSNHSAVLTNSNGISIGTGTTSPTPNDYDLEAQIKSGITISINSRAQSVDTLGNAVLTIVISVTNTSGAPIVVSEIGWKASVLNFSATPGGPNINSGIDLLLDRTLLDTPITIQSSASGLIEYVLKADLIKPKTISGVDIVPFSYGTDAQIKAMIEAAHEGVIDLQTDGGWRIGDIRKISIGAVGSYDAHDEYMFISSFDEYEGCGNVMQLDMAYNYLKAPMNSTNTNVGGYGESTMYTTFLPSVEAALPQWLRDLLIKFNVKASAGNQSSEIVTVTNNKLALRSVKEIYDGIGYGFDGEGTQVAAYKIAAYQKLNFSSSAGNRWARSPAANNKTDFCSDVNATTTGSHYVASNSYFIAPFMCV